jgi:hypothetical protein
MKYATTFSKALAVMGILVAAACATSAEVPEDNKQNADPTQPADSKLPPPSQPTNTAPPEKKCAPSCKTDSDCETTCPAAGSGTSNCCDIATNTCYKSTGAVCPKPEVDSGTPPPAY